MKTRRTILLRAVTAAFALAGALSATSAPAANDCANGTEIALINGRIHTMDKSGSVVSAVTMRNGKFVSVGHDAGGAAEAGCKKVINLQGRVAIPGLVDNHNHILLLGIRPGYHTPIESAASFADLAKIYAERIAGVPAGVFITSIGGFNHVQFLDKGRLPNLTELDGIAPSNPVYIQESFLGPSTTNTLGKAFFASKGVTVGADGSIAAGGPTLAALNALRSVQTFADKMRGTIDAMTYAAKLGVTTHMDMGGFLIPGSPNHEDEFTFDGAASWDPYFAYEPILELHRQGLMKVRVRVNYLTMDNAINLPILQRRIDNSFREFGSDWLKSVGLGEFITNWPLFGGPTPLNYPTAVRKAAERGWIYSQHTLSTNEDNLAITAWEQLNSQIPIAPLHWSIAHAVTITPQNVQRLKALGAGLALHGFRYLAGTPTANGPPYRMIVDSGVQVGAGSDSAQISTLNPWLMLYYMTTGKNSTGVLINGGQTVNREEALRLYTAANGWFSKEEDKIGSIEEGKFGDVVVLSDDYFTVSDDALKKLGSILTVVGGKITYDAGVLRVQDR